MSSGQSAGGQVSSDPDASNQREPSAEHMRVAFPAEPSFTPVGRVAVSGLALRLGFDIGQVEQLRLAVDATTAVLCHAGVGRVEIDAEWTKSSLTIALSNTDISLDDDAISKLRSELAAVSTDPIVADHHVVLRLGDTDSAA